MRKRRRLYQNLLYQPDIFNIKTYLKKVLSVERQNLIGCWLQKEGSGSISYDYSGNQYDGVYTGVTLGQPGVPGMGYMSPFYGGADDVTNLYSAALNAAFDGNEITVGIWSKVLNAEVWSDATIRYLWRLTADANNYFRAWKHSVAGRLTVDLSMGGTSRAFVVDGLSTTDWMMWMLTVSDTADEAKTFLNGIQQGATQGTLGTFVGNLSVANTVIGAAATPPSSVWNGWEACMMVWSKALSEEQALFLSIP